MSDYGQRSHWIEEDIIDTRQWHKEEEPTSADFSSQSSRQTKRKVPDVVQGKGRKRKSRENNMMPVVIFCVFAFIIGFALGKTGQKKAIRQAAQQAVLQAEENNNGILYKTGKKYLEEGKNKEALDVLRQITPDWKSFEAVEKAIGKAELSLCEAALIKADALLEEEGKEAAIESLLETVSCLKEESNMRDIMDKILEIDGEE